MSSVILERPETSERTEAPTFDAPRSVSSNLETLQAREAFLERDPARSWLRSLEPGLRRGIDIVAALTALTLLLPVFGLVALLIKLTSRGPVFYSQERVGENRRRSRRRRPRLIENSDDRRGSDRREAQGYGRPFSICKFRTMVVNAEEYGPQWSSQNDPRITPIGRFLRLSRLDETPQFLNVLRGEMSLIGPRPERPYFVNQFVEVMPTYEHRLQVRPGITGQAQVNLDYDTCIDDVKKKLEQDLDYITKRSIFHDLGIVLSTVRVVLTGKGAA